MKTRNLVALIVALLISTGGFEAINLLFTQAANAHQQASDTVIVRA